MKEIELGDIFEHPEHGCGEVNFVSVHFVGIRLENGRDVLLNRSSFTEQPEINSASEPKIIRTNLPWPDSTFVFEGAGVQRFFGMHWLPFDDDGGEKLSKRLPEMMPTALIQGGYGNFYSAPNVIPSDWVCDDHYVWPTRNSGLSAIARVDMEKQGYILMSFFPFFAQGIQTTLMMKQVDVWESGCEAQITAEWGEINVSFFDTKFLTNRAWYEAGKLYEFILTGLAYSAHSATLFKVPMQQDLETLAWEKQIAVDRGEQPPAEITEINLTGMAMFIPVEKYDKDDYEFRALIKQVTEVTDFLGQDGWRVRATVMRPDYGDADLDIVITRRVWKGDSPPQVGQDIEGTLWLQGHLWNVNK